MKAHIRVSRDAIVDPDDVATSRACWKLVSEGIDGMSAALAEAEDDFVAACTQGLKFLPVERELAVSLRRQPWRWPWLEAWLTTFRGWGEWPRMWSEIAVRGSIVESNVAELITHTSNSAFITARKIRKSARLVERPEWGWRLRHVNDGGGVAEQRVAIRFQEAIEAGDLSHVPPFFPGDRTALAIERAGCR